MENLNKKQWYRDEIARITSRSSKLINNIKCTIMILCGIPFLFKIPFGTYQLQDFAVNLILAGLILLSYITSVMVERHPDFRFASEIINVVLGVSSLPLCQYFMYIFRNAHPENLFFTWASLVSVVILALIAMRYSVALTSFAVALTIAEYAVLYFSVSAVIPPELKLRIVDLQTSGILQRLLYLGLASVLIILFTLYVCRAMQRISGAAIELNSMKNTFGQYVSHDILDYVLKHSINSPAAEYYGVVLFSDIRNFTSLMENHTSKETVARLNEYFAQMASIIESNGGYINKFIGDAILAVFGDINQNKENAKMSEREKKRSYSQTALKAAKEMSVALKEINKKWHEIGETELHIGIGLHAGNIIMGNVGSKNRMEFTCLGRTVSEAMDVEDLTKHYGHEIIATRTVVGNEDDEMYFLTDDPKVFPQPLYYVDTEVIK